MKTLKWDSKLLNESSAHIWVYYNGLLVGTNNTRSRAFIISGMNSGGNIISSRSTEPEFTENTFTNNGYSKY